MESPLATCAQLCPIEPAECYDYGFSASGRLSFKLVLLGNAQLLKKYRFFLGNRFEATVCRRSIFVSTWSRAEAVGETEAAHSSTATFTSVFSEFALLIFLTIKGITHVIFLEMRTQLSYYKYLRGISLRAVAVARPTQHIQYRSTDLEFCRILMLHPMG